MRIAVCTSDFYSPIHESIRESGHEVSHVFTSCDLDSGWSLKTVQFAADFRAKFVVGKVTERDVQEMISDGTDMLLSAAYDYKIPVPATGELKCINVHGSLLPLGRGPWPAPQILLRHPEAAGVTLHSMTNKWDFGEIVLQEAIPITDADNNDSLTSKTLHLARNLSKRLFEEFEALWEAREPMKGIGSYWSKPTASDRTITPTDDRDKANAIFRAFGRFTLFRDPHTGETMQVRSISFWDGDPVGSTGQCIAANGSYRIYARSAGFMSIGVD